MFPYIFSLKTFHVINYEGLKYVLLCHVVKQNLSMLR